MESIADEAGYAPQTVYFHFGSKAAILRYLIEQSKSELVVPLYQRLMASEDPSEQLALAVGVARLGGEAGWDLVQVVGSARNEPEFQDILQALEGEKKWGAGNLVASIAGRGRLRAGLTEAKAVDLLMVLTSEEIYRLLVVKHGWSHDEYEGWLTAAVQRELLQ